MRSALFVPFLLAVAALPAQDHEFGNRVATTLTQVRKDPEAFKNVKVNFTVQFASLGVIANPLFTKFTPTEFANFYAWADEQPIWQEKAYNDVFGLLFLSKSSARLETLYGLDLYQRVNVTGVVRNTFQNKPWIEVTDFTVVKGQLDTPTITHLYRGEKFMEQRQWQRAVAELSLANVAELPPTAARLTHKNLGICNLKLGEANAAIAHLEVANALGKDVEVKTLLCTATRQPTLALDRAVDIATIKDSERPIWEAFGNDSRGAPARPAR
ncbi:MAG: hypothetical protein FJ301_06390 [Planctomycetes bacterium]|nr:hypothetical protein [Planctomycetota bacterium]